METVSFSKILVSSYENLPIGSKVVRVGEIHRQKGDLINLYFSVRKEIKSHFI
jgi:hypothetical protein